VNPFVLDKQLAADCHLLGKLDRSQLLLLNNALLPWFILVPEVEVTEFYQLDMDMQMHVLGEINHLSAFVKQHFKVDKLNLATIGNKVQQLHIHIIGRSKTDFCWPEVVWGREQREDYLPQEVEAIRNAIKVKGTSS